MARRTFHEMEVSRTADEGGMKMNIKEDGKTTRNFILTQTVIVALDSKIYLKIYSKIYFQKYIPIYCIGV